MDEYTRRTKIWLDRRFRQTCSDGIYYAHQPIYGFRKGHSEPQLLRRYSLTYKIMKALSHIEFDSLLDVGGAEGYKAYILQRIFGVIVRNCDLSEEACKRAMEIFHIKSDPADIQELPYQDGEFDVALCSETLEHVANLEKAIDELLRVCKKAIVITVPHENKESVEKNIKQNIPHAHIHNFSLGSFDFLKSIGYEVFQKKVNSSLLKLVFFLIDAQHKEYRRETGYAKFLVDMYNICVPFFKITCGRRIAALIIRLDDFVCRLPRFPHDAVLFIILKDRRYYREKEIQKISATQTITFSVPYYYLQTKGIKADVNLKDEKTTKSHRNSSQLE